MARMILADDSQTIQKIVQLSFLGEPLDITCFSDGVSALDWIRKNGSDVVLADVFLPMMDGYDLCREIRTLPNVEEIPVVLLAGTFEPFDSVRAQRAGATAHLTKPFETSKLVSLVQRLLLDSPAFASDLNRRREIPPAVPFRVVSTHGSSAAIPPFELTLRQSRPAFQLLQRVLLYPGASDESESETIRTGQTVRQTD
jgi:CheY-like chemotaxis protein